MRRGILCGLWLVFAFSVPAATAQIEARLPVTAASPGDSVRLAVTISEMEGAAIHAYEFTLRYDPDILDVQGAEIAGTLSRDGMQIANASKPGEFRFALAAVTQLSGDGPLLILTGRAGKQGTSTLVFERFQFNEGNPEVLVVDGFLNVGSDARSPHDATDRTSSTATPDTTSPRR